LRELAETADVSPTTAVEMLDSLDNAGLVKRVRSTEDRRVVLTSLSDRGREVIDARRALYEPRWRAALQQFSEKELSTAAAVLEQVRLMFEELAEEGRASS
jgi:DNA-binding MarR family transcriptional regulator